MVQVINDTVSSICLYIKLIIIIIIIIITALWKRRPPPTPTVPDPVSGFRTPDSDDFKNLIWLSYLNIHLRYIFREDQISFLQRYETNCGKMSHLAMLKNPSNNPGYSDADDLQKKIISSLSVNTSVVNVSHKDPFSSFHVKLLTDRQTDRETYKCWVLHNLLGGGKKQNKSTSPPRRTWSKCGVSIRSILNTRSKSLKSWKLWWRRQGCAPPASVCLSVCPSVC